MEGAGRIFAGEYSGARYARADLAGESPALITPGGMVCRLLFVAGTLTEKAIPGGETVYARVADATGVFEIRKIRPDAGLKAALSSIEIPSFVTVLGYARITTNDDEPVPYLDLVDLREVDRTTRDTWIIRTSELTTDRLSLIKEALESGKGSPEVLCAVSQFHASTASVGMLAEMVSKGLEQVALRSLPEGGSAEIREKVLSIIRDSAGKSGVPLDQLITLGGNAGIPEKMVRDAVRLLLEEDECYQPARDVYKPL
jgi:RPA family protein